MAEFEMPTAAQIPTPALPGSGIAAAYARDPRYAVAQALMKGGQSTAPVGSTVEGIGRIAQALLGAWQGNQLQGEYRGRAARAQKDLADAMGADGGYEAVAKALLASGNPDVAETARGFQVKALDQRAKWADKDRDVAGDLKKMGLQVGPDGVVSQIPGFGQAKGDIAGAEAGAKKRVDLEYDPQIAAATEGAKNPALIARAAGVRGVENASDVQYAGPKAYATETGRTTADLRDVTFTGPDGQPVTMPAAQARAFTAETGKNKAPGNSKPFDQVGKLRDDFNGLQPVKNFREMTPIYASMQDAVKRDSKASDLNLVYGLAKMFDPASVVREGEMVLVQNTASLPDKLIGWINGVNGGNKLQADTRAALMDEARSRYDAVQGQHDQLAGDYRDMASRYSLNPDDVVKLGAPLKAAASSASAPSPGPAPAQPQANGPVRLSAENADAEFAALPAGAEFIGPDGVPRRKP